MPVNSVRLNSVRSVFGVLFAAVFLVACGQHKDDMMMSDDWTVSESIYVNAAPDQVWDFIGNYYDVHSWHPGIHSTQKSGAKDAEIRFLILGDGALVYEELLSDSDTERMYSYKILEAPLPVVDYVAQLQVDSEGRGSRVTWSSRFGVDGDEQAIREAIRGIFTGGLQSIADYFSG